MVRRSLVALLAVAVFLVPEAALAGPTVSRVKVLGGPASQFSPYRNANYLLYDQNTTTRPGHWDTLAKPLAGGVAKRLNAPGYNGFAGGFDPGTDTAIYQEWNAHTSDIRLYDLAGDQPVGTPHALRTNAWEWNPHVSTGYFSLFRNVRVGGVWHVRLYLVSRTPGTPPVIVRDVISRQNLMLHNDSLGEHHVSWTECQQTCIVRVYDIDTGITRRVATVNKRPQYASVFDETRDVLFFVRSGFACGLNVTFYSVSLSHLHGTAVKILTLPDGIDVANQASLDNADLLYPQASCSKGWTDIYALQGVNV